MSTDLVANFKSTGAQQMATDFKSVGTASGAAAGGISKASTASQGLGKTMKGSAAGIGQMATAFATLSLSIVNTYRSYRDLGDAQLAVDKANTKLEKSQNKLNDMKKKAVELQGKEAKGGVDNVLQTAKITVAQEKLAKALHDKTITSNEAKLAQAQINKMIDEGKTGGGKYAEALKDIAIQEGVVENATFSAEEAQESFNDTQQNFYLSIAPLAISSIATLATGFTGLKMAMTGGGGLAGALGPIGLILGGITLAIIAFKTNFLGIKEIIGGVINWVKERFGLWKQGFEDVFSFISKGDWEGAFNRIKEAAAAFWADLVKSVPLFGSIATFVNKIRTGNWKGAFLMIWKAAKDAWETIKKNVPILGKIEDVVRAISEGKWSEAFQKIADAAKQVFSDTLGKGIAFFFGANWKLGFDAAVALMLAKATANKVHPVVQLAVDVNAYIAKVTGIDIIKWFKDHPLTAATISFPLGGITFAVDDPEFRYAVLVGSGVIIDALGAALSGGAKLLDPYVAQLVKLLNWNTAVTAAREAILTAGQAIWDTIFQGIKGGLKGQDWMKLFSDFGAGVIEAWKVNMPETQKGIESAWNDSIAKKGLDWLGIFFTATPVPDPKGPTIIQNGITNGVRGGYKVPTAMDPTKFNQQLAKVRTDVGKKPATMKIDANLQMAQAKWQAFMQKVRSTQVTIGFGGSGNMRTGSQAGAYGGPKAGGFSGVVRQPTTFTTGEGGREEHVSITPRGSTGHSGGGGGGDTIVNVGPIYLDGEQVMGTMRYKINKFQGVMK